MICDLMTSLSIDMRTFMVREIKMEWDSLFCFLFFLRGFYCTNLSLENNLNVLFSYICPFKKEIGSV